MILILICICIRIAATTISELPFDLVGNVVQGHLPLATGFHVFLSACGRAPGLQFLVLQEIQLDLEFLFFGISVLENCADYAVGFDGRLMDLLGGLLFHPGPRQFLLVPGLVLEYLGTHHDLLVFVLALFLQVV